MSVGKLQSQRARLAHQCFGGSGLPGTDHCPAQLQPDARLCKQAQSSGTAAAVIGCKKVKVLPQKAAGLKHDFVGLNLDQPLQARVTAQ